MIYQDKLKELCEKDDRYLVMTAENRATIRNLPPHLGNRFIDTGITEQTLVGAAAGLALRGRKPITHALACFLTMRAFEFIRTDVGIRNLDVKLVGFVPGFLSEANGPTHQAIEDVSIMRGIPNMNVWAPASEQDLMIGLETILESNAPTYIRYNQRAIEDESFNHESSFEIGKAEVISQGRDVALLTYGTLLNETLQTKRILESQGLSVYCVNMRSLKPVDENVLIDAAEKTKLVCTIEDHFQTGGLHTILGETYLKNKVAADVLPIALDERWFQPTLMKSLLEHEGFSGEKMASRILEKLKSL